jgi:hypothetical protein
MLGVGLMAVLLSNCSNPVSLQRYTFGPPGHQVQLVAAPLLHVRVAVAGGLSAGTSVMPAALNYATALALPGGGDASVTISISPNTVPAGHAHWIINDEFNNQITARPGTVYPLIEVWRPAAHQQVHARAISAE